MGLAIKEYIGYFDDEKEVVEMAKRKCKPRKGGSKKSGSKKSSKKKK